MKPTPIAPSALSTRALAVVLAIVFGSLTFFIVHEWTPAPLPLSVSPAVTRVVPQDATEEAIRFYAARVQRDPEDTRAQNALAEYYLQRTRQTGNEDYLLPALAAARASLAAVSPERNIGGLTALAHAEFSNHDFAAAREHARQLLTLTPRASEPLAILFDAQMELGEYDDALAALRKLEETDGPTVASEIRAARLAILHGATEEASGHFKRAITFALAQPEPPNETIAWCRWQLGQTALAAGDYGAAEKFYRAVLQEAPNDFRALGSMGHLCAARGDVSAAFRYYEVAIRIAPVLEFMSALGDLQSLSGQSKEAAARYELVEQLGEHAQKVHGTPYDRRLALFWADHDKKLDKAYALARSEFDSGRHDILGADALAWTALKAGHLAEAQGASKEALRLGTQDARLFYHAGMIARAAGDKVAANDLLQRALRLDPHFDPLQSERARQALAER